MAALAENEKMKKVTFSDGLPRGTIATFEHNGLTWEAYPRQKFTDIHAVQVSLFATVERIHKDLLNWINTNPGDAPRVTHIMARTVGAKQLIMRKVQAWTWTLPTEESGDEGPQSAEVSTAEEGPADGVGGDQ